MTLLVTTCIIIGHKQDQIKKQVADFQKSIRRHIGVTWVNSSALCCSVTFCGDLLPSGIIWLVRLLNGGLRRRNVLILVRGTQQAEQPLGWAAQHAEKRWLAYLPALVPVHIDTYRISVVFLYVCPGSCSPCALQCLVVGLRCGAVKTRTRNG